MLRILNDISGATVWADGRNIKRARRQLRHRMTTSIHRQIGITTMAQSR